MEKHAPTKKQKISSRAQRGKYYIRDHIYNSFYVPLIESICTKRTLLMYNSTPIEQLEHMPTQSINTQYLTEMFPYFSENIKKMMNVTKFVSTINDLNLQTENKCNGEYRHVEFAIYGSNYQMGKLQINCHWRNRYHDEIYKDLETHKIPIIRADKEIYAITPRLIAWLQDNSDEYISLDKLFKNEEMR